MGRVSPVCDEDQERNHATNRKEGEAKRLRQLNTLNMVKLKGEIAMMNDIEFTRISTIADEDKVPFYKVHVVTKEGNKFDEFVIGLEGVFNEIRKITSAMNLKSIGVINQNTSEVIFTINAMEVYESPEWLSFIEKN